MEPQFELAYLVIPAYAYKDDRLTFISLKVYGFIHSYINPFFFSNSHLAKMFKCSERSISDAMSSLEKLGYIKMEHTPKSGGGTTRLAVDCVSDSQSSSSRIYSIKDNKNKEVDSKPIIKTSEELVEETGDSDLKELLEQKRLRRLKKTPFRTSSPVRFGNPPKNYIRQNKTGTHAEHIR